MIKIHVNSNAYTSNLGWYFLTIIKSRQDQLFFTNKFQNFCLGNDLHHPFFQGLINQVPTVVPNYLVPKVWFADHTGGLQTSVDKALRVFNTNKPPTDNKTFFTLNHKVLDLFCILVGPQISNTL